MIGDTTLSMFIHGVFRYITGHQQNNNKISLEEEFEA